MAMDQQHQQKPTSAFSEEEKWSPVITEGIDPTAYEVSSLGRLASNWRHHGRGKSVGRKFLTGTIHNRLGYVQFILSNRGKKKYGYIHRLVANAFVQGKTDERAMVNHLNGVRSDNKASNLEWTDNSGNQIHALKTGLYKPLSGESIGTSKLKNADVEKIFQLKMSHPDITIREIADMFGVGQSTVGSILRGKTWRSVKVAPSFL